MFEALAAGLRKDQVVTSNDHRQKDVAMSVRISRLGSLLRRLREASSLKLSGAFELRSIITPVMVMFVNNISEAFRTVQFRTLGNHEICTEEQPFAPHRHSLFERSRWQLPGPAVPSRPVPPPSLRAGLFLNVSR
jgi:hypothetical protein